MPEQAAGQTFASWNLPFANDFLVSYSNQVLCMQSPLQWYRPIVCHHGNRSTNRSLASSISLVPNSCSPNRCKSVNAFESKRNDRRKKRRFFLINCSDVALFGVRETTLTVMYRWKLSHCSDGESVLGAAAAAAVAGCCCIATAVSHGVIGLKKPLSASLCDDKGRPYRFFAAAAVDTERFATECAELYSM